MLAGNADIVSKVELDYIFTPGLTLSSALHLGTYNLSTAILVFVVNSVIVGGTVYGIGRLDGRGRTNFEISETQNGITRR